MTSRLGLKFRRFHDLAPFSIREVLLVASPYDAFILEEDALLTEQIFHEYRDLSLPASPRFTHVDHQTEALELLATRRFDLVLQVGRLTSQRVNDFARRVKALERPRPVVLLAFDSQELHRPENTIDREVVDGVFVWNGDAQILLTIIKYIEDRENLEHDMERGNVRVILMIEDSPRYYSSFLTLLYRELMKHARSLYMEGVNELHRRMYMSSRPKILHATSFEEGVELFERHQRNVLALISDADILRGGMSDETAGVDLVERARSVDHELPLLLQSSDAGNEKKANRLGATFVHKESPHILREIQNFLSENLGFGDFVFRNEQGHELDRALDLRELEEKLASVPEESLKYHASHNHFSIWLLARSEFEIAEALRRRTISEFDSIEEVRRFLIRLVHDVQQSALFGAVADFSRPHFAHDLMVRLGDGPLGGKARGLAFLHRRLAAAGNEISPGLAVRFPKSVFITAEFFDAFTSQDDLRHFAVASDDDHEIARRFLATPLPWRLEHELEFLVKAYAGHPLAVRSSSMLEDSLHQPFAGIYDTLMLPNQDPDPQKRLAELSAAVKLVYASTFNQNAKSYLQSTGKWIEEEKMAVIVQQLVGQSYGDRFYPTFSGVAESYNFYPLPPQKAEEGVVHVALGLGRFVVDGGLALRFNPHRPKMRPPYRSIKTFLDHTQRGFYALDLSRPCGELEADLMSTVRYYELEQAEADGSLTAVASVFSAEDRRLRDDLSLRGPRVITLHNILHHEAIPLADTLCRLLRLAEESWGGPVELEFACDMGDWGRRIRRGQKLRLPVLYLLQVRPFAALARRRRDARMRFAAEDSLCISSRSLGHGIDRGVRDIVYVRPDRWRPEDHQEIAAELERLNARLVEAGRRYILIGPGRWGSADEWLGIPVEWSQISGVRVIIEASPRGFDVEPSQGTHFFQNITSLRIGYLTLPPGARREGGKGKAEECDFLDWDWLSEQTAHPSGKRGGEGWFLRWVTLDEPLTVVLDGREGYGVIAKPGAVEIGAIPQEDEDEMRVEDAVF